MASKALKASEKRMLHAKFYSALAAAYDAGVAAAEAAVPRPMVVGTPRNMAASLMGGDDGGFDPNEPVYYVSEGVCGFAWVNIRAKATEGRRFCKWAEGKVATEFAPGPAVKHFDGADWRTTSAVNPIKHSEYDRATNVWVGGFGQSMARKEAFAHAFAESLHESGIEGLTAYSGSRMD